MARDTRSEYQDNLKKLGAGISALNEGQATKPGKPRRWKRKLAWILILMALIVFSSPYLASTGPGSRLLLSTANSQLPGELGLQDLSLSWLGPCRIKGLVLADPEGREVVHVDDIALAAGVWRLATSRFRFEKLSVDSPRITLYMDEHGQLSLLRAVAEAERPAAEKKPSSLPALTGKLALSRGSIRIVRTDGRQLEISRIDGDFSLEAMSAITGKLLVQADGVGTVSAEMDIQELVRDGRLQPMEATGKARLSTPVDLSFAGVGKFALGQAQADGTANLQVDAAFARGEVSLDTRVALAGLQVRRADSTNTAPIDVRLSSQLRATQASLTVHAALEGQIGDGQLDATYPWQGQAAGLSLDDIVSGTLAGKAVKWPDVVADAKARVDLARLAQAVPALLRIQPDVVVTGGELSVERAVVRGGEKPSTTGAVVLRRLASRRADQMNEWEPISLDWNVRIEPGTGFRVEKVAFTSGFAHLTAKGSPSDLHADFQSDLARLRQQAAQVFDLGAVELAGGTSGTLDLKRANQERIDLALALAAEGIRYRMGERHLEVGKLSAKKNGYFTLAGSKVSRLTIADAAWDADGRIAGTGSGWAGIEDGALGAELKIPRADLAYIAEHLAGLGVAGAAGYTGEATIQAKAERQSRNSPLLSDGIVIVRNTGLRGEPLLAEDVSMNWSGLSISPGGDRFEIKSAELSSTPARLSAMKVNLRTGHQPVIEGKVEGHADLARCLAISSRIAGREKPPAIEGRLSFSMESQGTADGAKLAGNAGIDGLAIGAGDKTIRENQLRLAIQAGLNSRQETVTVDQFQMDSQILAVTMTGKVSDYARTCLLDLSGNYRASWDAITTLIHELAPATLDTLTVAGASESRFTVSGAANQPQVHPAFKDTSAAAEVGWASAEICGVQMGKGLLAPALKQGQLALPVSTISAAGGQVRVGADVDFRPATPVLSLGRRLQILENVRITPELGRELLSRVNPIFGSMTRAEGTVSLMTENILLPLGDQIKTGGSGQGRLDLQNLKVQPTGLLMALLELGGLTGGDNYAVQVSGVDFQLKDGRLFYEKFSLTFGQDFDLRFHGSVGFDDTLDLAVSVPVRPALLERLGVGGPTKEYAGRLDKARVEIPIVGTRLQPRVDLAQVDLKPLIEEAARSAVSQGTDGLLKSLMGIKQAPRPEPAPIGAARPAMPGPGIARQATGEQGKALQKRAVDIPEAAKSDAARTARGGAEPLTPAVRDQARLAATKPAARQELPKVVASRPVLPAAQTAPAAAREQAKPPAIKPTNESMAGGPGASAPAKSAPAAVAPTVRERAKLPVAKPASQPAARSLSTSKPAQREVAPPRSAVRDRVKPPQTKPAAKPATKPASQPA